MNKCWQKCQSEHFHCDLTRNLAHFLFLVPYVYEKPPVKVLKDVVAEIKKEIEESKKVKKEKPTSKADKKKQKKGLLTRS